MKKAMGIQLCCILLLLTAHLVKAQEEVTSPEAPVLELKEVEQPPEFPGGTDRFYDYFNSKFKKPEVPDLIGKVFISFIVEPDGMLTDMSIYRDIGFGVGEQALQIVKESPRWIAGRKEGKRVRVHYILPIGIYIGKHD